MRLSIDDDDTYQLMHRKVLSLVIIFMHSNVVTPMSIQIGAFGTVSAVTSILNDAYRVGETGILMDTPDKPFNRVTTEEVEQMTAKKNILTLSIDGEVVGCIKVHVIEPGVAEWGCLAVSRRFQGQGFGTVLVQAVEKHIQAELNCRVAQLELLAPSSWKHTHKERLRDWYQRMGYSLAKVTYENSTLRLPQGSLLGDRFVLATNGDLTSYRKNL